MSKLSMSKAAPFSEIAEISSFPKALSGGVVAIGNFDGVHRGHQAVLETAREEALRRGVPAFALTFEPHPRSVFNPDKPVFRLSPQPVKTRLLKACGLDGVVVMPFTREFAGMAAQNFVDHILKDTFSIVHAVTGYDFHFGKGREGTPDFLRAAGVADNFGVTIVEPETDEGRQAVSSSRIRAALALGDVALARGLLGYCWFVESEVQHGEKRGRELGYPTANLALPDETDLAHGIYAVKVKVDNEAFNGVASFGRRPTFDNGAPLLEVHLFDASPDLYGKTIAVGLVSYLRREERFEGVEELISQMDIDSAQARAALAGFESNTPLDQALALWT